MLQLVFLKILGMSWSASIVILAVCLGRILLKKYPKCISYLLWSVVLFRLLCPITLESEKSLIPNYNPALNEIFLEQNTVVPKETLMLSESSDIIGEEKNTDNKSEAAQGILVQTISNEIEETPEVSRQNELVLMGQYIWIAGLCLLLLYGTISLVLIRKKVSESIPLRENIYVTDKRISPFVMGIFRPKIYLPQGLSEQEQEYIILHEKCHIRRCDHIVKFAAFIAWSIHWFNPLVWVAFRLFCKDMEMSCDEAVIKKMGEKIKIDYCVSLMNLSTHHRNTYWLPVDFGENDIKGRIKNIASLRKMKKGVLAIVVLTVGVFIVCLVYLAFIRKAVAPEEHLDEETRVAENAQILDQQEKLPRTEVWLDITEHYRTHVGDPSNFYYIDENNILWGSGRNEHGQLGQGTQDYDYHREAVRIAENVIHVDYSQKGFVIFLTEDHKLYGLGNAGCGALQQYDTFDGNRYLNDEQYFVSEPYLLMEQVKYACCGRDDIVCLAEDNTVWTWGTVWCNSGAATLQTNMVSDGLYFIPKPQKVLDNAVLVTGGWNNHAALLRDGTVWTWGYNSAGNCGVADIAVVSKPTMVAENVAMVWTNLALENYPQPSAEDIALAWTGKRQYNMEYDNISEFNEIYPKLLNNTVIQKTDGSYWVCGENVGEEEERVHGAEADYFVICTYQFLPCK